MSSINVAVALRQNYAGLDRSRPTAADLSGSTALQDYLDEEVDRLDRNGPIWLPRGNIEFGQTLRLESPSQTGISNALAGVTYAGQGIVADPADDTQGYGDANVRRGTTLLYTGPASTPAVVIEDCQFIELRDVTVQRQRTGGVYDKQGIGLAFRSSVGWACNFNRLVNVRFMNFAEAITVGDSGADKNPGADLSFYDISMRDCTVGFRSYQIQCVGFNFVGGGFHDVDTVFLLSQGGNLNVCGQWNNRCKTLLKVPGGGKNASICTLTNIRMDRTGGSALPIIYDAIGATGSSNVLFNGVQVTNNEGDDATGHYFFRTDDAQVAQIASGASGVHLGPTNLAAFGTLATVHKIGVYSDASTLVGEIDTAGNYTTF